jgi:KDO2-lipid IV(A) lauroyltransferase
MMTISSEQQKKRMQFEGVELIEQCVKEGQSVAMYLGHYCNWEWVSSFPLWLSEKVQCGQIYHPIENKDFDRLFLRSRQRQGALCIPMQDTLRKILEFRRAGQPIVVGYIADQKPHWVNIHHWVDFLHHDTPVLTGTERIVRKVNHAVVYLDMQRVRRGYYKGVLHLITREPGKLAEFELTDIYYRYLEASIRRAPEFWLWSHKRWARTRQEFNERFEVVDGKVIAKHVEG